MTKPLCSTPESNKMLLITYTLIFKKREKNLSWCEREDTKISLEGIWVEHLHCLLVGFIHDGYPKINTLNQSMSVFLSGPSLLNIGSGIWE